MFRKFLQTNHWPQAVIRLFVLSAVLVGIGLLFTQFVHESTPASTEQTQSRKINLALRRTAHHLLREAGDSTSRIRPVQQTSAQTFQLQFDRAFNYDKLPRLLQESLRQHGISWSYDVAVLDCRKGELQLGYTVSDLIGKEPVPCGGRAMNAGCYILQLTFHASQARSGRFSWWALIAGGLGAGVLFLTWSVLKSMQPRSDSPEPVRQTARLQFGNTIFDESQLTLVSGAQQHTLTYREAKLLRLFVQHANQVLERETILKAVWEDEGVTVGRSVDVFVSRLRKLLQHDPAVRIVAVHGVGYRLEVA